MLDVEPQLSACAERETDGIDRSKIGALYCRHQSFYYLNFSQRH